MKLTKYLIAIITILIMLIPVLLWAQGPGGGDLDGDPGAPIDGGASLLIGAGVIYGVRKLKNRKRGLK